jgi:hypothetical protein
MLAQRDLLTLHGDLGQWLSPRDLAQLFCKSVEAPNIEDEYGIRFQVYYGVSANTRSAWSIANARKIIGYEPQGDSEVVYADEIRELMLELARQNMVQGDARGGKGSC